MATNEEIQTAMKILIGAGLRNAPDRTVIGDMVAIWTRLLGDVPGRALIQAAEDIARTDDFFPSVRRIREVAERVQAHNFQSVVPNPWKEETRTWRIINKGCARIRSDGHYYQVIIDSNQPVEYHWEGPEIARRETLLEELDRRTGGIWSVEDYDFVNKLLERSNGATSEV